MARILIVDDEHDVLSLIKFLLEKDGHQIEGAENGQKALEKLGLDGGGEAPASPEKFDLVILDVMMPVMDGYTLFAKISAAEETRGIPVIILTAKGGLEDIFAQSSQISAYLAKPFDPQKLRQEVSRALARGK